MAYLALNETVEYVETDLKEPDAANVRRAIFALEDRLKECEQAPVITRHRFTPGLYIREMVVPADTWLTGAIHKTEHLSIMLTGSMIVTDGLGSSKEIHAPIIEKGLPGIKRIGLTLEEVRWITVHVTDETDADALDEMLTTNDFSEVAHLVDQRDYSLIADEYASPDYEKIKVQLQMVDGVEIAPSPRHGFGVFVTKLFKAGETIAPAIKGGQLMEYSRYCNHSPDPNARMVPVGGEESEGMIFSTNFDLVALRDVENEEVTVNYRQHSKNLEVTHE